MKTNCRGSRVAIPINERSPTHLVSPSRVSNNLDLVFVSAGLSPFCSYEIAPDIHSSNHLPVVCDLGPGTLSVESSSTKIHTRNVDWSRFQLDVETRINSELSK